MGRGGKGEQIGNRMLETHIRINGQSRKGEKRRRKRRGFLDGSREGKGCGKGVGRNRRRSKEKGIKQRPHKSGSPRPRQRRRVV